MDFVEIKNYKISCKITIEDMDQYIKLMNNVRKKGYEVSSYKNFCIVKGIFKYVIFCNGHINISGIKRKRYFKYVYYDISQIFDKPLIKKANGKYITVDNISATIKAPLPSLNLYRLYLKLKEESKLNIMYEPEIFHAIKVTSDYGYGLIFSTGKINYLGIKSVNNLIKFHNIVYKTILKVY